MGCWVGVGCGVAVGCGLGVAVGCGVGWRVGRVGVAVGATGCIKSAGVSCGICVGVADTMTLGVATDCMTEVRLDCDVGVVSESRSAGIGVCSPPMRANRRSAHPIRLMMASPATVKSNRWTQTSCRA